MPQVERSGWSRGGRHPLSGPLVAVALAGVFAGGAWLTSARATSASSAVAPASSVAVIRLVDLLDGLDEKTTLEARLDEVINERNGQLEELNQSIKAIEEDLGILRQGTPAHQDKARQLLELRAQAETRLKVLQQIISLEKGRMLTELFRKIQSAGKEIATRQGYDLVLIDDSEAPVPEGLNERQALELIGSRRLLHAASGVDITAQVRTYMNNAFQAGG